MMKHPKARKRPPKSTPPTALERASSRGWTTETGKSAAETDDRTEAGEAVRIWVASPQSAAHSERISE